MAQGSVELPKVDKDGNPITVTTLAATSRHYGYVELRSPTRMAKIGLPPNTAFTVDQPKDTSVGVYRVVGGGQYGQFDAWLAGWWLPFDEAMALAAQWVRDHSYRRADGKGDIQT